MAEVVFTENALLDIESIAEFIARDSLKYARIQIKQFDELAEMLVDFPEMGRIVPEADTKSIRELISGNYRFIYWLQRKNRVVVICVYHVSRRLKKGFLKKRKQE